MTTEALAQLSEHFSQLIRLEYRIAESYSDQYMVNENTAKLFTRQQI